MSHFRPPLHVFVGGRQPYAPALGMPQSGPVPESPPLRGAMAAATFAVIIAAWQPTADARQPRPQLVPATLVAVQQPPPSRVNTSIIVDSWRAPFFYPQGFGEQAAIDPIVNAPPAATGVNLSTILRTWQVDPPPSQGYGEMAGMIPPAVGPSAPPVVTGVNFSTILRTWLIDQPATQGYTLIAGALPPAVVSSTPPIPGRVTFGVVLSAWQPAPYAVQGLEYIAPLLEIPGGNAPPSRQSLQIALGTWQIDQPRTQGGARIAPLISVAAPPSNPPLLQQPLHLQRAWQVEQYRLPAAMRIAPLLPVVTVTVTVAPAINMDRLLRVTFNGRTLDVSAYQQTLHTSRSAELDAETPDATIEVATPNRTIH